MQNRTAGYFNTPPAPITETEVLEELLEMERMGLVKRVVVQGETRWSLTEIEGA